MKFCRLLRTTSETLPEAGLLFTHYKRLKKHLRVLTRLDRHTNEAAWREQENTFGEALKLCLFQLNDAFLEKEEELVMKLEVLESQSQEVLLPEAMQQVIRRLIDFHGETLLFMYWSMLAYTCALKIAKKHLKKTGSAVQGFRVETLSTQPICSTEVSSNLVHRVENSIQLLQSKAGEQPSELSSSSQWSVDSKSSSGDENVRRSEDEIVDVSHRTKIALDAWQKLIAGATTPSTILSMDINKVRSESSCASHA